MNTAKWRHMTQGPAQRLDENRKKVFDRVFYFICFTMLAGGLYTFVRGFSEPLTYPICQWFTTYEFGFIKRGLVGTVVEPLFSFKTGAEIRRMVEFSAMGIMLLKFVCVGFLCREVLVRARGSVSNGGALLIAVVWVFVMSPHVVSSAHIAGYFDHLLELFTMGALLAICRGRFFLVPVICAAGMCAHEMFAAYGLPTVMLALFYKLFGNKDNINRLRSVLTFAAITVAVLTCGVCLLVAQEKLPQSSYDRIYDKAIKTAALSSGSTRNMVDHLQESVSDNWKTRPFWRFWKRLTHKNTIPSIFPTIAFIVLVGVVLLVKMKRWVSIPLFVGVSISPILITLIASDVERFSADAIFQAFIALAAAVFLLPSRINISRPAQVILIVLGAAAWINGLIQPIPLMGNREDRAGLFSKRDRPALRSFDRCRSIFPNSTFDEGTLRNWHPTGDAFGPKRAAIRPAAKRRGTLGRHWLSSYSKKRPSKKKRVLGDKAVGTLKSKEFIIERNLILFKIAGKKDADAVYTALLVDGAEVYRTTGDDNKILTPRFWDVRKFQGKRAQIEITDQSRKHRGHIDVDQFCWGND